MHLPTIRVLLDHGDWSNDQLLVGADPLDQAALDRDMQIGPGTLRRTLLHIYNGEHIWLQRWIGGGLELTPWPSESESVAIPELRERFATMRGDRNAFLSRLAVESIDLSRPQTYRDSRGSLYSTTLGDMLIQGVLHSRHHQAQAVNILRRLGAAWPELDYMYRVRRPA